MHPTATTTSPQQPLADNPPPPGNPPPPDNPLPPGNPPPRDNPLPPRNQLPPPHLSPQSPSPSTPLLTATFPSQHLPIHFPKTSRQPGLPSAAGWSVGRRSSAVVFARQRGSRLPTKKKGKTVWLPAPCHNNAAALCWRCLRFPLRSVSRLSSSSAMPLSLSSSSLCFLPVEEPHPHYHWGRRPLTCQQSAKAAEANGPTHSRGLVEAVALLASTLSTGTPPRDEKAMRFTDARLSRLLPGGQQPRPHPSPNGVAAGR